MTDDPPSGRSRDEIRAELTRSLVAAIVARDREIARLRAVIANQDPPTHRGGPSASRDKEGQ